LDVKLGDFAATDDMKRNVIQVLDSGRLSPGPFCADFERMFADFHRKTHAIMSNSGTSALVVALQALKEVEEWPDGSEVIVPAITFVATVNAVIHCGLKPVLVDVDPGDYTIDTSLIIEALTLKTKAIIPVHVFGLSVNMSVVQRVASDFNLKVIEDSCEALGATYAGERVGSIGDIGCFSFYISHHNPTAIGGMVFASNPKYAQ